MMPRMALTVLQKELLDTFRDRRTLLLMFGVPVLLYPLLLISGFQLAVMQQQDLEAAASRVAVIAPAASPLREWVRTMHQVELHTPADARAALEAGEVDVVVEQNNDAGARLNRGGTARFTLYFDATELPSLDAVGRVAEGLRERSDALLMRRLAEAALPEQFASPIRLQREDVATPSKTSGTLLALLLPLFTVMTLALGAFYPAIDLTAGEKERGTFETLLSTPITKQAIVTGKFLAVFVLAMITAGMNLGSMFVTFQFLLAQLNTIVESDAALGISIPLSTFGTLLLVMTPLALLISAATMGIAVLARSFREAQHYLSPFFIIILLPTFVAAYPGIELSAALQYVPIANVVLLFKQLVTGEAALDGVFAVVLSTSAYAVLALWFAGWLFQREDVVLAEESGLPLSLRRSDFTPRPALTPGASLGLFCIMLLLLFYAGTPLQSWRLLPGVALTQWLLILLPTVLLLWYTRIDLRRALLLRRPTWGQAGGAVLAGLGWLVISIQVGILQQDILPVPDDIAETFAGIFALGDTLPGLLVLLGAVALSPAICEEVLFRGALFTGLRSSMRPLAAVLVVGLLFGIFHLTIYKLVPTGLTGAFLCLIAWRTRSLWPGVLVHGLVNGTAILIEAPAGPAWLKQLVNAERLAEGGVPAALLAVAAALVLAGFTLMERGRIATRA